MDILCSSPILAARDQSEWNQFYQAFGISSAALPVNANNGDEAYQDVYSKHIIYGTVGDFSGDVLRQEFEGKNTRGGRKFECLIVDEVDHLTLDSCLSLTYLSHSAKGMHHLRSVLAEIGKFVTNTLPIPDTTAFHKIPIFFVTFISTLKSAASDKESEASDDIDIIGELVNKNILSENCYKSVISLFENMKKEDAAQESDENNNIAEDMKNSFEQYQKILMDEVRSIDESKECEENVIEIFDAFDITCNFYILDEDNQPLLKKQCDSDKNIIIFPNGMISIFFQDQESVVDAVRKEICCIMTPTDDNQCLNLPTFLHSYVKEKLSTLINNAILSFYGMNEGESFKIASSGTSEGNQYDEIIPVDYASTGVLEKNKRYSEGIQQFLEVKHQLSVSDVTLTTNYLSNFSFYTRYHELHGLTGTLGNHWDKTFLNDELNLNCVPIPSHKNSLTKEYPKEILSDVDWAHRICEEVSNFSSDGQGILLICKDMNTAQSIYDQLKSTIDLSRLFAYWRDDTQTLPQVISRLFVLVLYKSL